MRELIFALVMTLCLLPIFTIGAFAHSAQTLHVMRNVPKHQVTPHLTFTGGGCGKTSLIVTCVTSPSDVESYVQVKGSGCIKVVIDLYDDGVPLGAVSYSPCTTVTYYGPSTPPKAGHNYFASGKIYYQNSSPSKNSPTLYVTA